VAAVSDALAAQTARGPAGIRGSGRGPLGLSQRFTKPIPQRVPRAGANVPGGAWSGSSRGRRRNCPFGSSPPSQPPGKGPSPLTRPVRAALGSWERCTASRSGQQHACQPAR
jgi:hypothetical protein